MKNMPKTAQEFVEKYGRIFSPSGSSKWLFCTGSIGLEAQIRKEEPERKSLPSLYASEGTVAHRLGAMCIERDVAPYSFIGDELAAEDETDFTYKIDLVMANAVNLYVEYALSLANAEHDPIMEVEQRLDLTGISPYVNSGTSDCWIYQRKHHHLHVLDLKYGKGIDVSAEHNSQLMIYALGVTQKLAKTYNIHLNDIEKITLHIIQPRSNNGLTPFKTWDLSPQVLPWFHEFILASIRNAFSDSPRFAPSENRCRWCICAPKCTARAELSMKAAQIDFNHLVNYETSIDFGQQMEISPIGNVFDKVPEPRIPNVNTLSISDLASIMRWKKRIEQFLNDVATHVLELKLHGERVPGLKLVRGRSIRQWKNEKEVLNLTSVLPLEKKDLFNEPKLKSPAQMEEVLKAKKLDRKVLEEYIIKPEGELTIALMTDGRPEVKPLLAPQHEFAVFKSIEPSNEFE